MESGKIFLKPEQFESEKQEKERVGSVKEAIWKAKESAKTRGKTAYIPDLDAVGSEIARLREKRDKIAENLKLGRIVVFHKDKPVTYEDPPVIKEINGQIERLKKARKDGLQKI